ncbi:hypothetical protein N9Z36_08930 [Luminiphilus sp.]|nr:hypothetical protein [Luminiphilus sp.]
MKSPIANINMVIPFLVNLLFLISMVLSVTVSPSHLDSQTVFVIFSIFNFAVLSSILFFRLNVYLCLIFLTTPLIFIVVLVLLSLSVNGELREYEATDSYSYDRLAQLLVDRQGDVQAFLDNTKYSYDDLGYPYVRYLMRATDGSNAALLVLKIVLHYGSSFLVYRIARGYGLGLNASIKSSLIYLNASVPLMYVCSGLKETVFTFFVAVALGTVSRSLWWALGAAGTFFFRKAFPFLILFTHLLRNRSIAWPVLLSPLLLIALYISGGLHSYYLVFLVGFDITVFSASLLSAVIGGIPSLFMETYTNFLYAPTIFLVNIIVIKKFFNIFRGRGGIAVYQDIFIFSAPLVLIAQALKIRYLMPFYFLYIIFGMSDNSYKGSYFLISAIIVGTLAVLWALVS